VTVRRTPDLPPVNVQLTLSAYVHTIYHQFIKLSPNSVDTPVRIVDVHEARLINMLGKDTMICIVLHRENLTLCLKRSHMDHSFYPANIPYLPLLVSIHQMAPPLAWQPSDYSLLLLY